MKKFLFAFVLLLMVSFTAFGQQTKPQTETQPQPGKYADTAIPVPEKVEVSLVHAQRLVLADSEIDRAKKELELAKQRREILELSLRLILQVPNDYVLQVDEKGNLFFAKPKKEKE